MFVFLFNQIILEENEEITSVINLVIEGQGIQSLINNSYYKEPFQVRVNGQLKDSCKKSCEVEME